MPGESMGFAEHNRLEQLDAHVAEREPGMQYTSRVLMHHERHGDKEGQELSAKGRHQLFEKGKDRPAAATGSLAIGSGKRRARHSAALDMAGAMQLEGVTGDETYDELVAKIDAERKYGTRVGTDLRLDWDDGKGKFKEELYKAFTTGQGLRWLVEKSDDVAKAEHEMKGMTYNRMAQQYAEMLLKYRRMAENFDKLVSDEQKKEQYGNQLERYVGTHSGILDTFLCRVVEEMHGKEERDRLVNVLKGSGFNTGEGFDVSIENRGPGKEPIIRIDYEREGKDGEEGFSFHEEIPWDLLEKLAEKETGQEE